MTIRAAKCRCIRVSVDRVFWVLTLRTKCSIACVGRGHHFWLHLQDVFPLPRSLDPLKKIGSQGPARNFGRAASPGLRASTRRHPNDQLTRATAEDAICRQSDFADHHWPPPFVSLLMGMKRSPEGSSFRLSMEMFACGDDPEIP